MDTSLFFETGDMGGALNPPVGRERCPGSGEAPNFLFFFALNTLKW